MSKVTNEELEEIRGRAARATEGPWGYDGEAIVEKASGGDEWVAQLFSKQEESFINEQNNGVFIATARRDVPRLCDALTEARTALRKFGRHKSTCNFHVYEKGRVKTEQDCDCGLIDALGR